MPRWTRNQVIAHRHIMDWPDLADEQVDQIVAILNEMLTTLDDIDEVSWIEPEIRFQVTNRD